MPLLLNNPELSALLEDFYVLTGIRISIRDDLWERIAAFPLNPIPFCMKMRSCSPPFNEKCMEHEQRIFPECRDQKKLIFFTCHAGLVGAVAPIMMGGELLGYIMLSQVSDRKNNDEFLECLREYCAPFGVDEVTDEDIRKIKYRKQNQIAAAAKIMEAVVSYILQKDLLRPSKKNFFYAFNQYIHAHLTEEITVERLCEEFHVSRTYLYTQLAEHTKEGVAGYIREQRLAKAEGMLKNTTKPIADIATAVGFSDYNYFLRVFKKCYGISPKALRRKEARLARGVK